MLRCVAALAIVAAMSAAVRADTPEPACKAPPAGTKVAVNFVPDTSIFELVAWISTLTCKNVVVDGEVRARVPTVTIVAPNKVTPKQALDLFVDALDATGLAVTVKKDTIQVKLGPSMLRSCPAVASATMPPSNHEVITPEVEMSPEQQKLLDNGVRTISEGNYEISKALADAVKANAAVFAKGARIVPAVKDGKPSGFKLYAIRPSSLIAKIGLTNGDNIQKINGIDLTSAATAIDAYEKAAKATSVVIDLERRGKPTTVTLTILTK